MNKQKEKLTEGEIETLKKKTVCVLSYVQLCDPIDCIPQDFSVHRISQARVLEWVSIPYSRGCSWPKDQTCISCVSCIGRWILYHWAPYESLKKKYQIIKLKNPPKLNE